MYTLKEMEQKYKELEKRLLESDIISDKNRYAEQTREFDNIQKILQEQRKVNEIEREIEEYQDLFDEEKNS